MRYILSEERVDKFVDYELNVWLIEWKYDKFELANAAINEIEKFFKDYGIPMTLSEIGIDKTNFTRMEK